MKKVYSLIVFLVLLTFAASAQPRAVGLRVGNYGVDVSYENFAGEQDFLEFELGLDNVFNSNAFHLDGIYNFMITRPDWSAYGQWGVYAGPGASVAVWDNGEGDNVVYAGLLGNVGIEYVFDIPLQISLSLRPRMMFGDGKIRRNGLFSLGLGVRYMF